MQTNTARTEMGETFYFSVSNGLQQALAAQSMDLVLLPIGPTKDPYEYLVNAVDRHIADAYVISNTHRVDPRVDLLTHRGVPFVALGRGGSAAHAWLDLDFEGVAAESVKRLARVGHQRIALAFDDGESTAPANTPAATGAHWPSRVCNRPLRSGCPTPRRVVRYSPNTCWPCHPRRRR